MRGVNDRSAPSAQPSVTLRSARAEEGKLIKCSVTGPRGVGVTVGAPLVTPPDVI